MSGGTNYIAYYRVSTAKQGRSGLGLEAQRQMVADFVAKGDGQIISEFTEIESGKSAGNRPQLQAALVMAKRRKHRATLIVAKLDRLAREVAFVAVLLDTPGVEFKAADFPEANRFMLHILSAVGEYERQLISDRTKAALAARKARGLSLGTPANLRAGAPEKAQRANQEAERLRPVIASLMPRSTRGLAQELERRGYQTPAGGHWHPTTVARVLARLATSPASPPATSPAAIAGAAEADPIASDGEVAGDEATRS